jgi:hypothetical protein
MWGSAFADLAKKAHELQEQASQIAVRKLYRHFSVFLLLCLSLLLPI